MLINENSYVCKKDLLFYTAWIIFLLSLILDHSMWAVNSEYVKGILKIGRYISYAIGMVKIFLESYEKKKFVLIIMMIGISIASFLFCRNITMVLYMVFFISAYNLNANLFLKVTMSIQSILLVLIVLGSQIGIVEDYIFTPESRLRHGLGFSWTTTGAILYLYIVFQYIAIRKEKIKYLELIILEANAIVLYFLTDSRMAFFICSTCLVFMIMIKIFKFQFRITKFFKIIFILLPSVLTIFSISLHALFKPENIVWSKLNDLLSGRLRLGKVGIDNYGISLFGTPITWVGYSAKQIEGTYNYVDCSYLQILLEYGVIFLIMTIMIYTIIIYRVLKERDYFILWSIVFVLIVSITEPRLMNLSFNPFPILVMCCLGAKEKELESEEEVHEKEINYT